MRSKEQLQDDLRLALKAVRAAEEPILRYFRSEDVGLIHKGDGSPVTLADQAAEKVIRGVLQQGSPDIDILGEEEGSLDRGPIDTGGLEDTKDTCWCAGNSRWPCVRNADGAWHPKTRATSSI